MPTSRAFALIPLAAVALFAGGCGSSDESSSSGDSADIAKAVQTGFTTTDVDVKCGDLVTASFLKRVYGNAAACRKAEAPDPTDKKPTSVGVSHTKVDGDKATTTVALKGGDTAGATGTVSLAKEDGKWKVDDLEVDLLRSELTQGFAKGGASIPGLDATGRDCVSKKITGLGDADLQRLAYASIAKSSTADTQLQQIVTACLAATPSTTGSTGSSGSDDSGSGDKVSFLRKKFEEGLTKSIIKDGATKAQANCVKKALRKTITDDEIIAQINTKKTSAALTTKAATAIQGCRDASS